VLWSTHKFHSSQATDAQNVQTAGYSHLETSILHPTAFSARA